ncbi:M42 family metallopeptidase [Caloramator sp. E03]|nr:M42 family metallopeptidase [Caloramator sp. E03]
MDNIVNLSNIPSPSGYTNKAISYIEKIVKELCINYTITNKGSLIATIEGKNSKYQRTVSAHIDTLGAMVKKIKNNGRISFDKIGGYMLNSIEGENCIIETCDGKQYTGTVVTTKPSVHIHSDAGQIERKLENMEIIIDEKVNDDKDVVNLGIEIGDFIFFDTRTQITKSGFIKSRHLDDKASAGILLGTIKYIVENNIPLPYTTNFYFTNYEEVGHGAAASIPENTVEFIAVDMGAPGEGQNSSEYSVCICAKDSHGPYDYSLRCKLVNLCKEKSIDYRIDIYPHYGSDASTALRSGYDIKTALIGPGVFASHGYERTHKDAILNTTKLLAEYLYLNS